MGKYKSYSEKLKDPRWQKKRLEILKNFDWKCWACGEKEKTLNVHHVSYKSGKNPWEYGEDEYMVLCDYCHEKISHFNWAANWAIAINMRGLLKFKMITVFYLIKHALENAKPTQEVFKEESNGQIR